MNKQTEALTLALEALESKYIVNCGAWRVQQNQAITAIREALADSALDRMAENARELGLDYEPIVEQVEDSVGMGHKAWDMVDPKELAKEFHKALAEPPCKTGSQCTSKCPQCDEPDGMHHNKPHKCKYPKCPYPCPDLPDCRDAEQPARKPWVGLTDAEFQWIYDNGRTPAGMMELVETKLKEKNA